MIKFILLSRCLLVILAIVFSASDVAAQTITYDFKPKQVLPDKVEASAIEEWCDGKYLVADDKKDLLIVSFNAGQMKTSTLGIPQPTNTCEPDRKTESKIRDWEAMAKDSAGNYYLSGSHLNDYAGYSFLIKFRLNESRKEGEPPTFVEVKRLCLQTPMSALASNGLKKPEIEGLTVQESGNGKTLIFAIREEDSSVVRVYQASLNREPMLTLTPFFSFEPDKATNIWPGKKSQIKWHLSSIEYLPTLGYLIMTSTEKGTSFEGNALWFVSEAELKVANSPSGFKQVQPSWSRAFYPGSKAEGLYVISWTATRTLNAVIVFDNDRNNNSEFAFVDINLGPKP